MKAVILTTSYMTKTIDGKKYSGKCVTAYDLDNDKIIRMKCVSGLWIYLGKEKPEIIKAKEIFDLLYGYKEEIEPQFSLPVIWDRKDNTNASTISVEISEDYTSSDNWERIAAFHVDMTKKLTEIIYQPHAAEIAKIVSES